MGGCIAGSKDPNTEMLKHAYRVFKKLDKANRGRITQSDIKKHFGSYSQASAKIMLRQIDANKDGSITSNQWIGYWQMVRRSGYRIPVIIKQLQNIQNGILTLNFNDVYQYQRDLPRSTVVNSILDDFKRSPPQNLPFLIQK